MEIDGVSLFLFPRFKPTFPHFNAPTLSTTSAPAFTISVPGDELLAVEIIPLSVLTLGENAVKYGISRKEAGGTIDIDIYREDQFVIIEITDSGVGFVMGGVRFGFGLYSVQERLKLFYKGRAVFRIEALNEGGTQAVLKIPGQAA
jgi:sensor histidine kinase YesM